MGKKVVLLLVSIFWKKERDMKNLSNYNNVIELDTSASSQITSGGPDKHGQMKQLSTKLNT